MMPAPQRKRFWAMVGDIAKQVPLVIGGYQTLAHKDDWRQVFACALMQETRIAEGLDGQKVVLGLRLRDIFPRDMPEEAAKARASDLITIVQAFGDSHSVKWSDPKEAALMAQYEREAA